jgi:hypothetical protein
MPGDSTINQAIIICDMVYSAFERGNEVHAEFLDISKAFDRVWHAGLLLKLEQYGIRGKVFLFLQSKTESRPSRLLIYFIKCKGRRATRVCPWASSLLFVIFINDLTNEIMSDIFLFADDSTLLNEFNNNVLSMQLLNQDLIAIENWSRV